MGDGSDTAKKEKGVKRHRKEKTQLQRLMKLAGLHKLVNEENSQKSKEEPRLKDSSLQNSFSLKRQEETPDSPQRSDLRQILVRKSTIKNDSGREREYRERERREKEERELRSEKERKERKKRESTSESSS